MRISRPFSLSLVAVLAGQSVAAHTPPSGPGKGLPGSDHGFAKGMGAMDALAKARSRSRLPPATHPKFPSPVPAEPSAPIRKRAFEAMKSRKPNVAMEAQARAAREAGEAQLARDREAMAKRLAQAIGLEAPSMEAVADAVAPKSGGHQTWVPVLFASSAIPVATLRAYTSQLERARGVIAFRGMPGGLRRVGPMAKLSAEILRRDAGCEGPNCAMRNVQLIVDPSCSGSMASLAFPRSALYPEIRHSLIASERRKAPPPRAPAIWFMATPPSPGCLRNMRGSVEKRRCAMLRLAWTLASRAWGPLARLPRQAADALTPIDPGKPFTDGRLWRAMLIVSTIALFVWWALPQLIWVRSPSIDARAVRLAPGKIVKNDLVMFTLRHSSAGPKAVSDTKYALCLPGDLLAAYTMRSDRYPRRQEAAYFCNGTLLGVSKPYGHDGQRLDFFLWKTGRIPAGKAYLGSSYKDGLDSRYFGLVSLSDLTRVERVL